MKSQKLGWKECNCEPQIASPSTYEVIKTIGWCSVIVASSYTIWYVLQQIHILRIAGYIN